MRYFLSLFFISITCFSFSQSKDYVITIHGDTLTCQTFNKQSRKCINGRETVKYKSKELKEFQVNDTIYHAVIGFKKWPVHSFHLIGNEKYHVMQYDFMEAQTSGPSVPRTKLLITDTNYSFKEELLLNETTAPILKKYLSGCHVFDEELKKFAAATTKRKFSTNDFDHLVNVYSNSCE